MTSRRDLLKLLPLPLLAPFLPRTAEAGPLPPISINGVEVPGPVSITRLWRERDIKTLFGYDCISIYPRRYYSDKIYNVMRLDEAPGFTSGSRPWDPSNIGGLILAESIDTIEKSARHYGYEIPGRIRQACEAVANGYHVFPDYVRHGVDRAKVYTTPRPWHGARSGGVTTLYSTNRASVSFCS